MRHRSSDAAVTAGAIFFLRIFIIWGFIIACGALLIPYSIETWAIWLGHSVVIEWWKGLMIGIIVGIILRRGIIWLAISTALVTWAFSFFGFTGF